ncbi:Phylloplanin like [Melia azedarach]|uniref:Phylloplanin like n=1 Tax=Melia azedarach TaxID=155640 RepID=A0ACC1YFN9_MELAZ|nr:Phylloplanin like [Melia azedarach]
MYHLITTAPKVLLLVSILVAAMAALIAEAQIGLISDLLNLIQIQGTVFCTPNGNIGVNGTATPGFPNAGVQLRCNGNVVSGATTNESGGFSMVLDPLQVVLSSLLSNCSLVVNTPLAKCNGKLPSMGSLISTLQFAGNTLLGILNVANIIPAGFHFMPQFNN